MKPVFLSTNASGFWSSQRRAVLVTGLVIGYINDEHDFGELRVKFDTTTWDVNEHGLIYTDRQFLNELQAYLTQQGLDGSDVNYSEQGMQGDDYVSCDVGGAFLQSWANKYNMTLDELHDKVLE